ncbi:hypothetical protein [Novosphingobium album (ex Hu et al. 2023)]|uniref:Transporter n=1 Tax=Novosphingobium album (ex Hu et al. 2023) TaxID=2930093 RepID=A0ABT0AZC1_9SPHN|nr:hypothetical protein [Novosphingobium album (ex Hu et al. 2023)]MCJ2178116.1 hypothetical protein [Novosphingobium album (ex Hu et al. 2023)]
MSRGGIAGSLSMPLYFPARLGSIRRFGGIAVAAVGVVIAGPALAGEEKAAEDPTKIATKAGVSYSDELSVSGSVAVGAKFKFNGRIAKSGQWSLGASYLFPVAILTFAAGRSELDSGVKQTRYSLGGFVPLNQLGLKTGKWLIFVPFGYSHTNSRQPVTDIDQQDGIPIQISSNSGYVGLFTLRPLNRRLTFMAGANFTRGTHDFSGIAAAGGLSYHLTPNDTVAVRGSYIDNTFGQKKRIGISYQHEF